ncbi:MAG TPA: YggS family pyridoxal phosphate-dependent enzyme [Patescibacteria group bacterium]|nr:YggS family pyridoxal phosphate-dependent enzyme [Patescibacteria group bacterium]
MEQFSLLSNYQSVLKQITTVLHRIGRTEKVTIIAVSKTQPISILEESLKENITIFGENYAQEFRQKAQYFQENAHDPATIPEWHFIGHLQTNKVKYVVPYARMIHSIDSLKLAQEISKHAVKLNRSIEILIQPNTSGEHSKTGCQPEEVPVLAEEVLKLPNLIASGLMTIPAAENDDASRREFAMLRRMRDELQEKFGGEYFHHLSMGMSHDFEIAIEEGATIVRIGTAIFGERRKDV